MLHFTLAARPGPWWFAADARQRPRQLTSRIADGPMDGWPPDATTAHAEMRTTCLASAVAALRGNDRSARASRRLRDAGPPLLQATQSK